MNDTIDIANITLKSGSHEPDSGEMCLLEAVAYIADEPWSDHPKCVCPVLAAFGRSWNDGLVHCCRGVRRMRALLAVWARRLSAWLDPDPALPHPDSMLSAVFAPSTSSAFVYTVGHGWLMVFPPVIAKRLATLEVDSQFPDQVYDPAHGRWIHTAADLFDWLRRPDDTPPPR